MHRQERTKMKKAILLCGMLLAASATLASAAGLNLRWNQCFSDGGVQNRTLACTVNSPGNIFLIGGAVLDADLSEVSGAEIVVDLQSASSPLPAWWQFKNVGACRQNSLSIANWGTGQNCFDWSSGQATPAVAAYQLGLHGNANEARILAITAVPNTALATLFGGFESVIMSLGINQLATVGTGSCAGCLDPVCLVFNSCNITTSGNLNNILLTGGATPGSDFATWQGGAIGGNGCPGATPTRNATWGSVKALYR